MIIVSKKKDLKKLEGYPKEVIDDVDKVIKILDENYGRYRDIHKDLGGYICIVESSEDVKELKVSKLEGIVEEFSDVLCEYEGNTYSSTLYLLSSDFAITVISKNKETDRLLKNE